MLRDAKVLLLLILILTPEHGSFPVCVVPLPSCPVSSSTMLIASQRSLFVIVVDVYRSLVVTA